MVDVSETSLIVTELFMDVSMADEILTSTPVMGMDPSPLNLSVNEVEDTSGSSVDFNVCAASVIIISDNSLSTFLPTSAEMAILFGEDSIAVEADAVPGISWGADIFTEDVDDMCEIGNKKQKALLGAPLLSNIKIATSIPPSPPPSSSKG